MVSLMWNGSLSKQKRYTLVSVAALGLLQETHHDPIEIHQRLESTRERFLEHTWCVYGRTIASGPQKKRMELCITIREIPYPGTKYVFMADSILIGVDIRND